MAAADVDADVFRSLSGVYGTVAGRATMYVGPKDMALKMSTFLYSFPRAGFTPPVMVVDGVDTIGVENLDLLGLGHGYVSETRDSFPISMRYFGITAPRNSVLGCSQRPVPKEPTG